MDIHETFFTGSFDLPDSALAFASVRDGALVFCWNLHAARQAVLEGEWDLMFETANDILSETLNEDAPTVVRLVS